MFGSPFLGSTPILNTSLNKLTPAARMERRMELIRKRQQLRDSFDSTPPPRDPGHSPSKRIPKNGDAWTDSGSSVDEDEGDDFDKSRVVTDRSLEQKLPGTSMASRKRKFEIEPDVESSEDEDEDDATDKGPKVVDPCNDDAEPGLSLPISRTLEPESESYEGEDEDGGSESESSVDENRESESGSPVDEDGGSESGSPVDEDGGSESESPVDEDGESEYGSAVDEDGESESGSAVDEDGESESESPVDEDGESESGSPVDEDDDDVDDDDATDEGHMVTDLCYAAEQCGDGTSVPTNGILGVDHEQNSRGSESCAGEEDLNEIYYELENPVRSSPIYETIEIEPDSQPGFENAQADSDKPFVPTHVCAEETVVTTNDNEPGPSKLSLVGDEAWLPMKLDPATVNWNEDYPGIHISRSRINKTICGFIRLSPFTFRPYSRVESPQPMHLVVISGPIVISIIPVVNNNNVFDSDGQSQEEFMPPLRCEFLTGEMALISTSCLFSLDNTRDSIGVLTYSFFDV